VLLGQLCEAITDRDYPMQKTRQGILPCLWRERLERLGVTKLVDVRMTEEQEREVLITKLSRNIK